MTHTTRDWRGIKHHLDTCSTEELVNLRSHAEQTSIEVTRFIRSIEAELDLQAAAPQLRAA